MALEVFVLASGVDDEGEEEEEEEVEIVDCCCCCGVETADIFGDLGREWD